MPEDPPAPDVPPVPGPPVVDPLVAGPAVPLPPAPELLLPDVPAPLNVPVVANPASGSPDEVDVPHPMVTSIAIRIGCLTTMDILLTIIRSSFRRQRRAEEASD